MDYITAPSHVVQYIISQSSYAPSGHRMTLDTRVIGEAETGVPHTLQEPLGPTGPPVTVANQGFTVHTVYTALTATTFLSKENCLG